MNHCHFCKTEVAADHYNCPQELEMRLINLQAVGQNILAKATQLAMAMNNKVELQQPEVQNLLGAIDPLNLAMGSNWAALIRDSLSTAEQVAELLAAGHVEEATKLAAFHAAHKKKNGLTKPALPRVGG